MISVGVIGARRGLSLAAAFAAQPQCQVVSILEPDDARRDAFLERYPGAQAHTDLDGFLGTALDVVAVASPIPQHAEHTIASLKTGAHVLQEVILGATIADCEAIVQAVRQHPKQKFMLAENCCYWAHIMSWRAMYGRGDIGRAMYAEAEYIHDTRHMWRQPDGSGTWRLTLPPIHYCTHSLGPLLMVTGDRCVSASGLAVGPYTDPTSGHYDLEAALFRTASGAAIKILIGFGVLREPAFHYYSIYGTQGVLETTRPPSPLSTSAYLANVPHMHGMATLPLNTDVPGVAAVFGGHGTAESLMVRDFVASIVDDTPPPISLQQAWDMSVPGLVAHRSAMSGGGAVTIPGLP